MEKEEIAIKVSQRCATLLSIAVVAIGLSHSRVNGYTGIVLYPLIPPRPSGQPQTAAGGLVAGFQAAGTGGNGEAYLFTSDQPTGIDLGSGYAYGTDGAHAVGSLDNNGVYDAVVWSGSPPTPTVLTVANSVAAAAFGISGSQIVGSAWVNVTPAGARAPILARDAGYWPSASSSFVDLVQGAFGLNGQGSSFAVGTDGSQQVGYVGTPPGGAEALLWSGTAASMVNLNPTDFVDSEATGVSDGYQVGYGSTSNFVTHAFLWHGTAASVVDLTPTGFSEAYAEGINGNTEVGYGDGRALLWHGSAASAVDLGADLPTTILFSYASTVDSSGNVYGVGDGSQGNWSAVEWLPNAPFFGDANLDGKVDQSDLNALTIGQDDGLSGWSHGDFNQDGVVNGDDWALFQLGLVECNQSQGHTLPEPGLLMPAAGALLFACAAWQRKHRARRIEPRGERFSGFISTMSEAE